METKLTIAGLLLLVLVGCASDLQPQPPTIQPITQVLETRICGGNVITASELGDAEIIFIDVVDAIRSLDEFERWLRLQPCIVSVVQEGGIVKTAPPMKEFIVKFNTPEGQVTNVIDVVMLDNNRFFFGKMHDGELLSDIRFLLERAYVEGLDKRIEVKIMNSGSVPYLYRKDYAACDLEYFDASGRKFIIPPGTHCDLVVYDEIKPGEVKTLFDWNLDECIEDRWGCVKSKPLPIGEYTIKGTFTTPTGKQAAAQATFIVIDKDDIKNRPLRPD